MSPHLPQRSSLPSLPVKREDNEDYLFFLYIRKIGPQCVRVATAFLFALVCEYDVVEYVQLF